MVTSPIERNDTAVRMSKWLDKRIEHYISDKKIKIEFPSKRNFVDNAVMKFLEEKGEIKNKRRKNERNRKSKRNI